MRGDMAFKLNCILNDIRISVQDTENTCKDMQGNPIHWTEKTVRAMDLEYIEDEAGGTPVRAYFCPQVGYYPHKKQGWGFDAIVFSSANFDDEQYHVEGNQIMTARAEFDGIRAIGGFACENVIHGCEILEFVVAMKLIKSLEEKYCSQVEKYEIDGFKNLMK